MSLDLAISFDDTGSMSSIRLEVRRKVADLVTTMFNVIPDLRIGIVIHNDYCDTPNHIRSLDFTASQQEITNFLNMSWSPGGEGPFACYELALKTMNSMSWRSEASKVAVLIGDEEPHNLSWRTTSRIQLNTVSCATSWKDELNLLATKSVKIVAIQALGQLRPRYFYDALANQTGGSRLDLSQFAHITSFLMAIVYREAGQLETYESSQPEFTQNYSLQNMFAKLKGKTTTVADDLVALMARFQVSEVAAKTRIDHFVKANGIIYKAGRGFYQLVKSENIQSYKEIIMVNRVTGEIITDSVIVRNKLGLPSSADAKLKPTMIPNNWDVYVQSTSYTRQLDADTKFLYEVVKK